MGKFPTKIKVVALVKGSLFIAQHKVTNYNHGRMWEKCENTQKYRKIFHQILTIGIVLEVTDFSKVIAKFSCRSSPEFTDVFPYQD